MPYTIKHISDGRIIEAVLTGTINLEEMLAETKDSLELAVKMNTSLFLSDSRDAEFNLNSNDIITLIDSYGSIYSPHEVRIAILPSLCDIKEITKFYETVGYNRGWKIHTFMDRSDAIQWLLI